MSKSSNDLLKQIMKNSTHQKKHNRHENVFCRVKNKFNTEKAL